MLGTTMTAVVERGVGGFISFLAGLPGPVQRFLAGRPVEVDGRRVFTEVQVLLRLVNLIPIPEDDDPDPEEMRAQSEMQARVFGVDIPVATVEDLWIPTRDGRVAARLYRAERPGESHGTVVYYHGGGWVVGSLDTVESTCRFIAANANVTVISVEYRLAPEDPFPAAVHDAVDAYLWVRRDARYGRTVAVAGDSAGGNLAAVVAQVTRNAEEGGPDFQLLYYPATDMSRKRPSVHTFATGFMLTEEALDRYKLMYLQNLDLSSDPLASPLLGDLAGVAPAHVVVAGFDTLRDEGRDYAEALAAAGVPVTLQESTGNIHGFVNAVGVGVESAIAVRESLAVLTAGLRAAARGSLVGGTAPEDVSDSEAPSPGGVRPA